VIKALSDLVDLLFASINALFAAFSAVKDSDVTAPFRYDDRKTSELDPLPPEVIGGWPVGREPLNLKPDGLNYICERADISPALNSWKDSPDLRSASESGF